MVFACRRSEKQKRRLQDFSHAIELDPGLGAASFQRGIVLGEMGRPTEALDDLSRSAKLGFEPARVQYQMALVYLHEGDGNAARKCIAESLEQDPTYAPALSLQTQLKSQGAPAVKSRR